MVFIGSSAEASSIAHAIKKELAPDLETIVWNEDIFELGEDTLTSLLKFVSVFDFAIFVMSDDDLIQSRGWLRKAAPRDNVVFELGLFMGAMGKRRSFPLIAPPKKGCLKTPSDLLGNTEIRLGADFRSKPIEEAIKKPCARLRETILARAKEAYLQLLPSTGLAVGYFKNFLIPACNALAYAPSIEVNGATIDISNDNFDFNIILPDSLSVASPEGATKYFKANSLISVSLPTSGRPYPLHVDATVSAGRLQIFDYPTTLGASHEAIKVALASTFLGYSAHHQILDNKEIENFRRTIEILLKDPGAAGFADNIKIHRL